MSLGAGAVLAGACGRGLDDLLRAGDLEAGEDAALGGGEAGGLAGNRRKVDVGGERLAARMHVQNRLSAGEVGYIIANIRNVRDSRVGDTVTDADRPAAAPLPGYKHVTPMVFAGLFPTDTEQYPALKEALER